MKRSVAAVVPLLLALLVLCASPRAHADSASEAAAENERGKELHKQGDREGALARFRAAYELSPEPRFLYNIASVLDDLGRTAEAAEAYERYLAHAATDQEGAPARYSRARSIELRAAGTRAHLAAVVDGVVAGARFEPRAASFAETPRPATTVSRWYQDPVGDVLVGAGVAGLGISLGLLLTSGPDLDVDRYSEHAAALGDAQSRRELARIVAGVGGALLVAGVVRWIVRGDVVREAPVRLDVSPGGSGAATIVMTVRGSF